MQSAYKGKFWSIDMIKAIYFQLEIEVKFGDGSSDNHPVKADFKADFHLIQEIVM